MKLALLAAGNAESLCIPLGGGRYITVGTIDAIQRLLPRDPFEEPAANDEVRRAGPHFNFPVVRK